MLLHSMWLVVQCWLLSPGSAVYIMVSSGDGRRNWVPRTTCQQTAHVYVQRSISGCWNISLRYLWLTGWYLKCLFWHAHRSVSRLWGQNFQKNFSTYTDMYCCFLSNIVIIVYIKGLKTTVRNWKNANKFIIRFLLMPWKFNSNYCIEEVSGSHAGI